MTSEYNHQINRQAHQRRCRAALELLQAAGPQLPFEVAPYGRHYTDRQGRSYAWNGRNYVGID